MQTILTLPRDAWHLARPIFLGSGERWTWSAVYNFLFVINERWKVRALLLVIIVLNLSSVGTDVVFSYWQRAFYNTLQTKDFDGFLELMLAFKHTEQGIMPGFVFIAALSIAVAVSNRYLSQALQIRARQWMTTTLLADWLSERAYYRISLNAAGDGNDNPDQRIAEDVKDFVEQSLGTAIDFMSNIVSMFSFIAILWSLSGPLSVFGVVIPAYLVWVALLYAAFGTALTHLIGRKLIRLRFRQQKVEADFRFSLARLRENMEAVALSDGEAQEKRGLLARFADIRANWWDLMQRGKLINIFVNGYSQVSSVFPFIVAAPRYFKGTMELGGLTQTVGAFSQVQGSMSWFVTSYASLANLRAIIDRLLTFQAAIAAARAHGRDGLTQAAPDSAGFSLSDATLRLPDGRVLIEHAGLSLPPGVSTAITGRTGSGKSTLFRALAGIWPFASGVVRPGAGRALFLPQRPYFPLGTLREALCYPAEAARFSDGTLAEALADVGLPGLVARLDQRESWGQILSGGEQQRLSLARALLIRPDWLFMDEATANLDHATEQAMLAMLREKLPGTTLISITHRADVAAQHEVQIRFDRSEDGASELRQVAA
jgi:putative ATP-binding cassette transporter